MSISKSVRSCFLIAFCCLITGSLLGQQTPIPPVSNNSSLPIDTSTFSCECLFQLPLSALLQEDKAGNEDPAPVAGGITTLVNYLQQHPHYTLAIFRSTHHKRADQADQNAQSALDKETAIQIKKQLEAAGINSFRISTFKTLAAYSCVRQGQEQTGPMVTLRLRCIEQDFANLVADNLYTGWEGILQIGKSIPFTDIRDPDPFRYRNKSWGVQCIKAIDERWNVQLTAFKANLQALDLDFKANLPLGSVLGAQFETSRLNGIQVELAHDLWQSKKARIGHALYIKGGQGLLRFSSWARTVGGGYLPGYAYNRGYSSLRTETMYSIGLGWKSMWQRKIGLQVQIQWYKVNTDALDGIALTAAEHQLNHTPHSDHFLNINWGIRWAMGRPVVPLKWATKDAREQDHSGKKHSTDQWLSNWTVGLQVANVTPVWELSDTETFLGLIQTSSIKQAAAFQLSYAVHEMFSLEGNMALGGVELYDPGGYTYWNASSNQNEIIYGFHTTMRSMTLRAKGYPFAFIDWTILQLPPSRFAPYITAGAGPIWFKPHLLDRDRAFVPMNTYPWQATSSKPVTSTLYVCSGGLQYQFLPRWQVEMELAYNMVDNPLLDADNLNEGQQDQFYTSAIGVRYRPFAPR